MSIGDLVLVNAFLLQLSMPLNYLGMVYREVKQAMTHIERMFALLAESRDVQDATDAKSLIAGAASVRFERVGFGYDPRRSILHELSFEIPAGQTVAVVGATGAGKSTLARLLYRFYDVDSGRITLNGQDLRAVTQSSLRAAIGIVPQEPFLFSRTIRDNITYAKPEATPDEIMAVARAAEAHDFIMDLPQGYETIVGERGQKLSGGQRQRISIARAVLKDPPVLILDEATSSVDNETEAAIQRSMERITVGRTTIVIAHRLSTVRNADRIFVLENGILREQGRHEDLLRDNGIYATLWRVQTGERLRLAGDAARAAR